MAASPTARILAKAAELGFDAAGIAPGHAPAAATDAFARWVAGGRHAAMDYLARRVADGHREARTIIAVALAYPAADAPPRPGHGWLARYARTRDYHKEIGARLRLFAAWLHAEFACTAQPAVDTAPVLERAAAELAGLGGRGRNTCLIHPALGSWFCLGEILTDLDLPATTGAPAPACGDCRRCLDACPTGALDADGLDARRCLSYLTIENRGAIPERFRAALGNRVCGCDTCQAVCPRNAAPTAPTAPAPCRLPATIPLAELLAIADQDNFVARFAGTPVIRAGRRGLLRNAIVAAGNSGCRELRPAVVAAAAREHDPMLDDHARWALERLGNATKS